MAPSGTVMSIGPSVKVPNDFLSPRISIAAGIRAHSFSGYQRAEQFDDVLGAEAGFVGLAQGLHQELARVFLLRVAAAFAGGVGHEGAKALAAIDDAFALQLLVRALHGDDADKQIFGEAAKRRQRRAWRQAALADLAREAVHDLLIEGTRRRR